jgi:hypothetical protein
MTPQEKAKELVENFENALTIKDCALIAIDELIEQENKYNNGSFYPSKYWKEVKQEIRKL